jgi:uncharacterized protein YbcI
METGSLPGVALGAVAAAISNDVVRVLHTRTGRGPTQAKTVISGDIVVCMLSDTLTVGERTLVNDGAEQSVLDTRKLYQAAMREDLSASVMARTGRRVIAFMSDNHIDPDVAIEAFVLEPRGDGAATSAPADGASDGS